MLLFEDLNTHKIGRIEGDNFFSLVGKNKIIPGSYVYIGYFADNKFMSGKTKQMRNCTVDNDRELRQYIEALPEGKLRTSLEEFIESPKYKAILNLVPIGKKIPCYANLGFGDDAHIVKISRINTNWRTHDSLTKFYTDKENDIAAVRRKYGFGKDETEYPEDDWRRKREHGGLGLKPKKREEHNESENKDDKKNKYVKLSHLDAFYQREDNGTLAIRVIENPRSSQKPYWYFVSDFGKMFKMDNKFVNFLRTAFNRNIMEEIKEMSQEEQDFINELKSIKNYDINEMTMIFDHVAFIIGAYKDDETGHNIQFRFLNDKRVAECFDYINQDELKKALYNCISGESQDNKEENAKIGININGVANVSESLKWDNALKEAIDDIFAKHNKRSKLDEVKKLADMRMTTKLYENIMLSVSKMVKKAINEHDDLEEYEEGVIDAYEDSVSDKERCKDEIISLLKNTLESDHVCISDSWVETDDKTMVSDVYIRQDDRGLDYVIFTDELGNEIPDEFLELDILDEVILAIQSEIE